MAMYNIPMLRNGLLLELITVGFNKLKVNRMNIITPSKDEILLFQYCTSAGLL